MNITDLSQRRVYEPGGALVRLGDEWAAQPAVLVWLRHFGCIFCRQHAAELSAHQADIEALGARLVFIGNGAVGEAARFAESDCPGCRVFTDPELRTYVDIGARRSWRSTVSPGAIVAGVRAFGRGHRQTRVQGVPDQQGGVVVVLPGGRVAYAHLSRFAGDHAPIADILRALREAPGRQDRALPAAG